MIFKQLILSGILLIIDFNRMGALDSGTNTKEYNPLSDPFADPNASRVISDCDIKSFLSINKFCHVEDIFTYSITHETDAFRNLAKLFHLNHFLPTMASAKIHLDIARTSDGIKGIFSIPDVKYIKNGASKWFGESTVGVEIEENITGTFVVHDFSVVIIEVQSLPLWRIVLHIDLINAKDAAFLAFTMDYDQVLARFNFSLVNVPNNVTFRGHLNSSEIDLRQLFKVLQIDEKDVNTFRLLQTDALFGGIITPSIICALCCLRKRLKLKNDYLSIGIKATTDLV